MYTCKCLCVLSIRTLSGCSIFAGLVGYRMDKKDEQSYYKIDILIVLGITGPVFSHWVCTSVILCLGPGMEAH